MPKVVANRWKNIDIEIEYESFGDAGAPALFVVSGFGAQMLSWNEDLCRMIADRGFRVIRFDNRDCGLSTKLDGVTVDMKAVMAAGRNPEPGAMPEVPYTLSGFSDDAFGLMSALGIEKAHIAGSSMGGMIVQTMAIEHPERVLSMTSIMSTTGGRGVGGSTKEASDALLAPPHHDREAYIDQGAQRSAIFAPHRHHSGADARRFAAAAFDRSFYPEGTSRQLAAIRASGDREAGLAALTVPTLVLHGRVDPIIQLSGGLRTAELVPGARLLVLSEMGHDLPRPLWPVIVDAIVNRMTHTAV